MINREIGKLIVFERMNTISNSSPYIKYLINNLLNRNISWALVGGAPRDWIIQKSDQPKDLDIAVSADANLVDKIVMEWANKFKEESNVKIERTSFGGYKLHNPSLTMDVWAATETVNIAKGNLFDSNTYRAVAKSAALSIDSLVVTCKGTIYDHGFFNTLDTGLLQLNHSKIDQPENIALKAIRLCENYKLIPDFALQSLILSAINLKQSLGFIGNGYKQSNT